MCFSARWRPPCSRLRTRGREQIEFTVFSHISVGPGFCFRHERVSETVGSHGACPVRCRPHRVGSPYPYIAKEYLLACVELTAYRKETCTCTCYVYRVPQRKIGYARHNIERYSTVQYTAGTVR